MPSLKSILLTLIFTLTLHLGAPAAPLPARVQERAFQSRALGQQMRYLAVLPPGYNASARRYPVLYLLHGWAGDYRNWVTMTNLVADCERYPMIVITPDARNSWYVNSPQERFQDYVTQDLIADVDAHWRTIASPHRRAVAGLSMGGYGAVLLTLKHPGLFAMAGSVSGAFEGPIGIEKVMPVLQESVDRAYGPAASPSRAENDVYALAGRAPVVSPYLFVECGSQDPFLPANRRFAELLSAHNLAYEYHEYPGGHTWKLWDQSLSLLLEAVAQRIVWQH